MDENKDQIYFHGKWFDNVEDMLKYSSEWPNLPLDQETAERLFGYMKKEIIMNILLFEAKLTNGEMREILHDTTMLIYEKLLARNKENKIKVE